MRALARMVVIAWPAYCASRCSDVEIDAQLVGMLEVVGAHRVRIQVDAPEVHHPQKLRRVAHDVSSAAGRRTAGNPLSSNFLSSSLRILNAKARVQRVRVHRINGCSRTLAGAGSRR
jgi:hypothetical protein